MAKTTRDKVGYYIDEKLSDNQALTPEGFLLCRNVPIARTGDQLYMADEIGLDPRGDGLVKIIRDADEVFRPETQASFEGKPVTIDHPDGVVTPKNWKQLTVGTVQNVRRGDGIQDDLLLADLLITDQRGIEAVRGGLREVSCGYDAEYIQLEPGIGKQADIIGNHVALVERGRAGPRCSIQDKETVMKPTKKPGWLDKLRKFIDSEEEAMKAEEKETTDSEAEEEDESKKTKDESPEIMARLDKIEAVLAKLVPVEEAEHQESFDSDDNDDDEGQKTTDEGGDLTDAEKAETNSEAEGNVWTGDSLKVIRSRAEILAPGIKLPTNDSGKGAEPRLMRAALQKAAETKEGKECIAPFLGKQDIAKLTNDSLQMVFTGAAEMMRARNNQKGVRNGVTTKDFGAATSIDQLNAKNREFWASRTSK